MNTGFRLCVLACAALTGAGCGKKGPPLPPLRLVPVAPADVVARRSVSDVELRFTLPARNQNGSGPVDLDRVEIYAITVPAGAPAPANRDLLTKDRLVGTVPVRPPVEEGEAERAPDPKDERPESGERVIFTETLTPEKLTPVAVKEAAPAKAAPEQPAAAATSPKPGSEAAAAAQAKQAAQKAAAPPPDYPTRVYAVRGISRGGRPGPPAERVVIPLISPPPPPGMVDVEFGERAFNVTWVAPVVKTAGPLAFNVYAGGGDGLPLNPKPLGAAKFELAPVRFGEKQCFAVRTVLTVQSVAIESAPSDAECVVPVDVFPPDAPKGLQVVAAPGAIVLSWNANTEPDLAGYMVLRAEAPGDTLQPLTPEPISDPGYRDTAVQPGVRYVYAVVAVDRATPPNTSAQSERQDVTAR